MDPYAVLGLRPGASTEDIKKRYRELARQWHPDRNKEPGAGAKMQQINTAYEQLINGPVYRRSGMKQERWSDPFGFAPNMDDVMRQWEEMQKNSGVHMDYDFKWWTGSTHTNARPMKKCPHCNGTGEIPA